MPACLGAAIEGWYCHNHAWLLLFWFLSVRRAEQIFLSALGGALFAPAATPVPHQQSLRCPYRSCRRNQSSPDYNLLW